MSSGFGRVINKGSMEASTSSPTIRVEIYNQTYSIRSDGDNEYILDLAEYVDGKMREIDAVPGAWAAVYVVSAEA